MKKSLHMAATAALATAMTLTGTTPASATETNEPVVDLSNMRYGSASFNMDTSAVSKTAVKTRSGQKIYLNVRVNPMPKRTIKPGSCRRAPVGKWFFNETIDPVTGKHVFKRMRVERGDNVFCKDRQGVWRKKSCGNRAKGIFGVPKPPRSLIRYKGVIQDYLSYSGAIGGEAQLDGSGHAYVVQYYEGKKVCEASATISGKVAAWYRASVKVRSRSLSRLAVVAGNTARSSLSNNTTVTGDLRGQLNLHLEGKAEAMCNFTPPPAPEEKPVIAQITEFNDLEVNWTSPHCVTADFPKGHSGTVFWTAKFGSFATSTKSAQDMVEVCSTYKAPSEVPAGGTDTITVTVTDSTTGLSVTKSTDPFVIHGTAPHPQ